MTFPSGSTATRLERYREMRDFSRTPEPRGRVVLSKKKHLAFYIQRHVARRLHYDFRLELGGVLKSWAVPKGPSLDPREKRLAVQTEDHPLEYGEFEGVIPAKQYGAGEVLLWDRGLWIPEDGDPEAALRKGRLHFRLEGEKLHGAWTLTRMRDKQWLLIKRRDEDARSGDEAEITLKAPQSVKRQPPPAARATKSGLPRFIAPQLATLVSAPPMDGNWIYEVKHDGYRLLARLSGGEVRLFTRSGKDWTAKLPHLVQALKESKLDDTWLDGEIVVLREDGRSSFQALQSAFEEGKDAQIVYFVFDAPFLDGLDLRRLPLSERRKRLRQALERNQDPAMRYSEDLSGEVKEVLEHACKLGLEGLMGKQAESVYVSGRTKSWIKLKCRRRQDFVIVGYTAPGGSRHGFGALLVGFHDAAGKLHYAGKVGTGFDEALLRSLTRRLAALKRSGPPSLENPPREKGVTWVKPVLVAEVEFAERTAAGVLRQAAFVGLREDISAKAVGDEKPQPPPRIAPGAIEVGGVVITHPERLIWPSLGITKLELARYIGEVGEWMLPQVANRPLTLLRCPEGAEAKCFYQRHPGAGPGAVGAFKGERSGRGEPLFVNSIPALISLVQNGAVELHTWGVTLPDARHPDRITLDLDPDPELPWEKLRAATVLTQTLLDALKLTSFLKTTGGKGLHVVIPLLPRLGRDGVREFSRLAAEVLAKARPDLFTAKMAKQQRTGKLFVDYLRNADAASAVAAYSPRARPGATVSTPLAWEELDKSDLRTKFTVRSVPRRLAQLRHDPWRDYFTTRQSITATMRRALGAQ